MLAAIQRAKEDYEAVEDYEDPMFKLARRLARVKWLGLKVRRLDLDIYRGTGSMYATYFEEAQNIARLAELVIYQTPFLQSLDIVCLTNAFYTSDVMRALESLSNLHTLCLMPDYPRCHEQTGLSGSILHLSAFPKLRVLDINEFAGDFITLDDVGKLPPLRELTIHAVCFWDEDTQREESRRTSAQPAFGRRLLPLFTLPTLREVTIREPRFLEDLATDTAASAGFARLHAVTLWGVLYEQEDTLNDAVHALLRKSAIRGWDCWDISLKVDALPSSLRELRNARIVVQNLADINAVTAWMRQFASSAPGKFKKHWNCNIEVLTEESQFRQIIIAIRQIKWKELLGRCIWGCSVDFFVESSQEPVLSVVASKWTKTGAFVFACHICKYAYS